MHDLVDSTHWMRQSERLSAEEKKQTKLMSFEKDSTGKLRYLVHRYYESQRLNVKKRKNNNNLNL